MSQFTFAPTRRTAWPWVARLRAVLMLLALAASAAAQTVTGTIFGRVVDAGGLPLPGVTVTVTSPQLIGGPQIRATNEIGEYRFPAMPPGEYVVQFEMQGFLAFKREGVVLAAGSTVAADATLQLATVEETVTVVGATPLVDVRGSALRETASRAIIENTPINRTFVDVFNLMPGVVDGGYNVATTGTNSVHGGTVRNNVFSIDGVNVNDPLVAYPGTDLNLDTVEEVQVTTAGMAAEFGGASGAVFNVITKSGGNDQSGLLSGYYRDRSMQSTNVTDELRAQGVSTGNQITRSAEWSGSTGGPLVRNRVWYFGNYQRIDEDQTMINFPSLISADQDAVFGKGTGQVSARNRVEGFYQYRLRYDEPFIPNVNEQDPRVWRRHRQSNHTSNSKWTSTLSDSTFFEARGSIANQRRFTSFPNASDTDYGYRDTSTGQTFGGWYRELARPGHRNSRQVKADLTHYATNWGAGSHELKTGFSYDWLINTELREWLAGARIHLLFNGVPDRIQLSNAPVNQKGAVNQWAVYVQDQWIPTSRLTINAGVRIESIEGWYPAGSAGGVNFPKLDFPAQRDVVNFTNAAPRLGFVLDLFGNRRTVVRGTYGRFYNQVYTSEFDAAVPFAFGSKVYQWIDRNGDLVYQPGEEGVLISDSTVPAIGRIDPDLKQSYVDSFTIGIGHELTQEIVATVTFLRKQEHDLAEQVNAQLPFDDAYVPVTLTNPLGGPVTIYPLRVAYRGLPTIRFYTNPGSSFCSFCPDLERKYRAVEFTVQKRMRNRWQLSGSYVFSRSEGNKGQGHSESQGNVFANPNSLVNTYGRLNLDRPHQFKLQGTYELPWQVLVSANYQAYSGAPWARQIRFLRADTPLMVVETQIIVNGEPVGAQRMDAVHNLSLRGEKRFQLGGNRLGLIADVFNLPNLSTVTSLQQRRIDHPDFAKPGSIILPRTLRVGLRFEF
jgi:hypothetical protein